MTATVEQVVEAPKPVDRDKLVKALIAALKKAGITTVDGAEGKPMVLAFNGETVGYIQHGVRVTRVDRRRTKTDGKGNERQAGDHKAAHAWTKEWEAFHLKTDRDVKVVAEALIARKPKAEKAKAEKVETPATPATDAVLARVEAETK